jgi:hypothetical protein
MRKLTQPWKLCRSFGSQPVGSLVVPRLPKVRIIAQQIPSRPSSRNYLEGQSPTADLPTCRPADLPTCRPADLPTCRPADLVVDDHWDFVPRNPVRPQLRYCLNLQIQGRRFRISRTASMCHALTCSSKNPIVYSGVTAPNHLVAAPTFPVKTARNRGGLLVVICFLWAVVYLSVLLTEVNAESLGDFQAEGRIAVEVPRLPSANRSDDRFSVCRSGRFSIATLTGAATVVFVNDGMDSFTLRIPSDPQIPHAQLFISPGWAFGDSIYAFLAAETAFGTGNGMLSTNWLKKLPFLSSEVFPAADIQVRIVQLKPEQQSINSQEIVIFGPARWKGKDDEWVQNSPPFEEGRPVASIRISHAQKSTIPANDKIVSSIVLKHLVPVQDALSDRRTEIFQQWIAELGAKREPPAASFMSNYLTIHRKRHPRHLPHRCHSLPSMTFMQRL